MTDRIFLRLSDKSALGADDLQSCIGSDLMDRARSELAGYPDTFDAWKAAQSIASRAFGQGAAATAPESELECS
jgi:hypothetical protein